MAVLVAALACCDVFGAKILSDSLTSDFVTMDRSRDKNKTTGDNQMFDIYFKSVSAAGYDVKLQQRFLMAWHRMGQEGIVSDGIDAVHDDDLPQPTFHHSVDSSKMESPTQAVVPTRCSSKKSSASSNLKPRFSSREPEDNDTIPPAWVKLLHHMQTSRNRKCKDKFMFEWAGLVAKGSPVLPPRPNPSQNLGMFGDLGTGALFPRNNQAMDIAAEDSDDGRESNKDRQLSKCADCGMFKRREKMRDSTEVCLKCSRRGRGVLAKRKKESATSTPSEFEEEED